MAIKFDELLEALDSSLDKFEEDLDSMWIIIPTERRYDDLTANDYDEFINKYGTFNSRQACWDKIDELAPDRWDAFIPMRIEGVNEAYETDIETKAKPGDPYYTGDDVIKAKPGDPYNANKKVVSRPEDPYFTGDDESLNESSSSSNSCWLPKDVLKQLKQIAYVKYDIDNPLKDIKIDYSDVDVDNFKRYGEDCYTADAHAVWSGSQARYKCLEIGENKAGKSIWLIFQVRDYYGKEDPKIPDNICETIINKYYKSNNLSGLNELNSVIDKELFIQKFCNLGRDDEIICPICGEGIMVVDEDQDIYGDNFTFGWTCNNCGSSVDVSAKIDQVLIYDYDTDKWVSVDEDPGFYNYLDNYISYNKQLDKFVYVVETDEGNVCYSLKDFIIN